LQRIVIAANVIAPWFRRVVVEMSEARQMALARWLNLLGWAVWLGSVGWLVYALARDMPAVYGTSLSAIILFPLIKIGRGIMSLKPAKLGPLQTALMALGAALYLMIRTLVAFLI